MAQAIPLLPLVGLGLGWLALEEAMQTTGLPPLTANTTYHSRHGFPRKEVHAHKTRIRTRTTPVHAQRRFGKSSLIYKNLHLREIQRTRTHIQANNLEGEQPQQQLLRGKEKKKRRWDAWDVGTLVFMVGMHSAALLLGPLTFTWNAFALFLGLYFVTGLLGITLSYHRHLSHHSFSLPKWLEYLFAYCGALALQGHPMDWVSTHRYHHQFSDSERDPHSPCNGFWFSHINWLFDRNYMLERVGSRKNVADLEQQFFYRFMEKTYIIHPIAMAVLLYGLGGPPFLVWGMVVRIVWVYHLTWLVNSASHIWGYQNWNTGDFSRNNWWVSLLAFGEGWHNNHHAFEYSARHGLEWWQFDPTWYVIKLLEVVGLAKNVKVPLKHHKAKLSISSQ